MNSALVAPTVSASLSTISQGQTSSLNSTSVTTGTSPYTYQWLQKAPGAGSYLSITVQLHLVILLLRLVLWLLGLGVLSFRLLMQFRLW